MSPGEQDVERTYRVFCAYGPRHRAPGCGWERFVETEEQAERLVRAHSRDTHHADYEQWDDREIATDGGREQSGTSLCWDGHSCPIGGCDGELQQQDRFNVLCLECETVWTHYVTDEEHILSRPDQQHEFTKPRVETDGGCEQSGDRPRHICTGCKKVITCRQPPTACHDCGGYYRRATDEDVACDRCGDPDGHRLLDRTGEFDRLCDGCIEELGLRDGQPIPDGGPERDADKTPQEPVGMPPHKYEQAKERARDDLDRSDLTNLVHGLPCVCEVLVDGEDEPWRPTTVTIGFVEDYGGGISDTITVMHRAGWRVDDITFGSYRRVMFVQRGEPAEDDRDVWIGNDEGDRVPEKSEPADFGGGESTGVQDL